MEEKQKRQTPSPQRGIGFLRQLIEQVRLSWALLRDDRVPTMYKLIPILALIYVISPIDLIPDVIPILGQLDDVGIFVASLSLFNSLAPADVVAEHLERIQTGDRYKVSRDKDGVVIDMPPLIHRDNDPTGEDNSIDEDQVYTPQAKRKNGDL